MENATLYTITATLFDGQIETRFRRGREAAEECSEALIEREDVESVACVPSTLARWKT
jgi:hypothetical protein